jgi:hypothetical protein
LDFKAEEKDLIGPRHGDSDGGVCTQCSSN